MKIQCPECGTDLEKHLYNRRFVRLVKELINKRYIELGDKVEEDLCKILSEEE